MTAKESRRIGAAHRTSLTLVSLAIALLACGTLPSGPLMAYELDGVWCDRESPQTCLSVIPSSPAAHYVWQVGLCFETGRLTGGLEFTPATDSRLCLAPDYGLYSASGKWTTTGIRLELDTATNDDRANGFQPTRTVELEYQ
jgi:hypothetical protein